MKRDAGSAQLALLPQQFGRLRLGAPTLFLSSSTPAHFDALVFSILCAISRLPLGPLAFHLYISPYRKRESIKDESVSQ